MPNAERPLSASCSFIFTTCCAATRNTGRLYVHTNYTSCKKDVHLAPTNGRGSEDNGHDLCKRCDRLPLCGRRAGSLPAMSHMSLSLPVAVAVRLGRRGSGLGRVSGWASRTVRCF